MAEFKNKLRKRKCTTLRLLRLAIDESVVLWRGRLVFRQYIKNKRHKYGVKLYELTESRGLVLKIRSGEGVADEQGFGQSAATVLELLDSYLDKGYIVFTDNYYNSVSLTKFLTTKNTYICGTLRFDRKENPKELVRKQLKKGDTVWSRSESVVVCKWKDKRDVLTISNMHRVEMVDAMNRNRRVSKKPNIVNSYNKGMSGIDRSDQMLSYYSSLRKTIRWYKKIALHIVEVLVMNSHILYNENHADADKMTLLKFRESVVSHLVDDIALPDAHRRVHRNNIQLLPNEDDDDVLQHLSSLPPTDQKQRPTKPCRICTRDGLRRETRYCCTLCPEKPALCVGDCFRRYHTD